VQLIERIMKCNFQQE